MDILQHSPSNTLTLDETLAALAASDTVDGLALVGGESLNGHWDIGIAY